MAEPPTFDLGPLGSISLDRIYPVVRAWVEPPTPRDPSQAVSIRLCDDYQTQFTCPSSEMPIYHQISYSMLEQLGLTADELMQSAGRNLTRLFDAHQETFDVNEIVSRAAGSGIGVWAMDYAGESDDACLVSGLLVLPAFLTLLKSAMVQAGSWPDDAILGAVVPVRCRVLLCDVRPRPDRGAMLDHLRGIVAEMHDSNGTGDETPVSRSLMVLQELHTGSVWHSTAL